MDGSGYGLCHQMDLDSSHDFATYQLVTLGKSLRSLRLRFFICKMGIIIVPILYSIVVGLSEIMQVKYLA